MPTERDYSEWAEAFEAGDYRARPIETPEIDSARLRRGRPTKGSSAGKSPSRQVRLPKDVSDRVDEIAKRTRMSASEVMRTAISEYVERHSA